jgi:hypothetical protein
MKTPVHLLTVLVIDREGYGPAEAATLIENMRHLTASVLSARTADAGEWSDDHPLNHSDKQAAEAARLFPVAYRGAK